MSNNNSSANIIINSMIHHSKLLLKRQQFKTKTLIRLQEEANFVGGGCWKEGTRLREHAVIYMLI